MSTKIYVYIQNKKWKPQVQGCLVIPVKKARPIAFLVFDKITFKEFDTITYKTLDKIQNKPFKSDAWPVVIRGIQLSVIYNPGAKHAHKIYGNSSKIFFTRGLRGR